ncbi:MAG: hypothetical protein K2X60_01260 [Xanthobacteraceae bacterium]|nr:hypothetical protein [Xanthobacteraceae bacterium]
MLGQAIANVQKLEKQVTGKTPAQLNARIAIRACLKELRSIAADAHQADQERNAFDGNVLPFISRAPSLVPTS